MDLWTKLKSTEKDILVYGIGNGADKIMNTFDEYRIRVSDIFTSDEFYREKEFRGFKLLSYSQVLEKYKPDSAVIVLAFAVFREDMLLRIKEMMNTYEVVAPSVSVFGDEYFSEETLVKYEDEIKKVSSILADEKSKEVFEASIQFRITGNPKYLFECETSRDEVFEEIISLDNRGNEVYVDLGAYRGDTIEEFLELTKGRFSKIVALEPDEKNYKKCLEYIASLEASKSSRILLLNKASWDSERVMSFSGGGGRNSCIGDGSLVTHAVAVDSVLLGTDFAEENDTEFYNHMFIKMDVEGAEHETLQGLSKTIEFYKPKLAVSAYHRVSDLFTLPLLIRKLNPQYKIFLRHHPYIPDWESNYYCI